MVPPTTCPWCFHPRRRPLSMRVSSSSLKEMTASAGRGCETCAAISGVIRRFALERRDRDGSLVDTLRLALSPTNDRPSLQVIFPDVDMTISLFYTRSTPWLLKTLPDLPPGDEVPSETSSEASLDWLRRQLAECRGSHKSCSVAHPSPLPKRVLDLGMGENGGPVRLHESGEQETEPYICLSHCWGSRPLLRTLSSNVQSHMQQIPWEQLPLTFQETAAVVRRLGFRYLWIDSLCIIQDDRQDWAREAARMADIFRNSTLVVTAARAHGAADGLFAEVPPEFATRTAMALAKVGEQQVAEIHGRLAFSHVPGIVAEGSMEIGGWVGGDAPAALPTLRRGWILQERLLARRVAHFGPQELAWECLERSACQCTREEGPPSSAWAVSGVSRFESKRRPAPKAFYSAVAWRALLRRELWPRWHRLVEDYSRLALTFDADVFPALSGLAQQLRAAAAGESRYLAGLWRDNLPADLLWHALRTSGGGGGGGGWGARPPSWRAPTWSWASVRGPVAFSRAGNVFPCFSVAEARCVAADDAGRDGETGRLAAGHLCVSGTLVPTTVRYESAAESEERADPSPRPRPRLLLGLALLEGRRGNSWADYDCSLPGPGRVAPGAMVHCFAVGTGLVSEALYFLVLRAVGEDAALGCGVFERIGLVELLKPYQGAMYEPGIDEALKRGETALVKII